MPISPQQQYSDYGLLVPRRTIRFRYVSNLPGVNSGIETKVKPVVITSGKDYDFEGIAAISRRSGLLIADGSALKVEGCNIEHALSKKGVYRTGDEKIPVGYILAIAEKRLDAVRKTNERLIGEGFLVAYKPETIIHYGREFRYSPWGIWGPVVKLFGGDRATVADEFAAPVFGIEGETRASELYMLKPMDGKAARQVAYRLGLMAGAQDRVRNVKMGGEITNPKLFIRMTRNYAVFIKGEQVYLAWVGNEDAFLNANFKPGHEDFSSGIDELIGMVFTLGARADDDEDEEDSAEERANELEDQGRKMVSGLFKSTPYHNKNFRTQFEKGFDGGYKNPDKREPIPLEMLVQAFDLRHISSN